MKLLLIGAGQLGSRHLQACLKHHQTLDIYVVDNSECSLELSKARASEIDNKQNHLVHYVTDISFIDESSFDYLILATGASVRYQILRNVLKSFSIKYAILEKVLFQSLISYTDGVKLIKDNGVKAFVNCPLRVYPFFKMIKNKYFSKDSVTCLKYVGGEWIGLACNSIHYLDLMNYLTDETLNDICIEKLDNGYIDSKRQGNIEFTGIMEASFSNGSKLSVEAIRGSSEDSVIEIFNGKYRFVIDELSGKYQIFDNDELVANDSYQIVYQSDLSHKMLEQLESDGDCELIRFGDSVIIHQEFIRKLLEHFNRFSTHKKNILPIT